MPVLTNSVARRCLVAVTLAWLPATAAVAQEAAPPVQEQARPGPGIIGIVPALTAETVGAPAELVIQNVTPYSPAYQAGLQPGDRIVAVAGRPVEGLGMAEIVAAIRGDVGTPVALTVERGEQTREVELTRVTPVERGSPRRRG